MGTFWIIIIFVVVITIPFILYQKAQTDVLMKEGNLIKRKGGFWEREEVFALTGTTLADVRQKLSELNYESIKASTQMQANGGILVSSKKGWNAVVEPFTKEGETDYYCCRFIAWSTERNIPDIHSMNAFYTMVEKAMLSLDSNAILQTRRIKTKTKTDFI